MLKGGLSARIIRTGENLSLIFVIVMSGIRTRLAQTLKPTALLFLLCIIYCYQLLV